MKVTLTNMCMIHNLENNKVLVLDKVVKEGWEGLTFPGGHVEEKESLTDSCIREIREETNLNIEEISLKGLFEWYIEEDDERIVGLLYYTNIFSGELIEKNIEGKLYWIGLDEFLQMKNKSASMDDIMKVYMEGYKEIISYHRKGKETKIDYIK